MTKQPTDEPSDGQGEADEASTGDQQSSTKTPMFQAFNAARYQRQDLIRSIQKRTGRPLICYVSGPDAGIDRDDTVGFVDLLHNLTRGVNLDLLLHTGGGDIDSAEKLISMVRALVGKAELRVVVPDWAKSAGTLMALAADRIVMSDTSELGPIDPQITLADGNGNRIRHSVQSYLDAYNCHSEALKKDPEDAAARVMLNKLDPATVKLFESVRKRAQSLAEDHLKQGMFRESGGNFTQIASELIDTKRWLSHGQMIDRQDAEQLGLVVEYLDSKSEEWRDYWRLYCLQRLAATDSQKLFESDFASLTMESSYIATEAAAP